MLKCPDMPFLKESLIKILNYLIFIKGKLGVERKTPQHWGIKLGKDPRRSSGSGSQKCRSHWTVGIMTLPRRRHRECSGHVWVIFTTKNEARTRKNKSPKQPLHDYREEQISLCFPVSWTVHVCSFQQRPALQMYASYMLPTLSFPQCWIISVFHRRMKISNKIIHSELIIGEKITSLYSFGGMCILRRVLEGNA